MFMECDGSRQWRARCRVGDWWTPVETKDRNCCGVNHGTKQATEAVSQWEEQKQRRRRIEWEMRRCRLVYWNWTQVATPIHVWPALSPVNPASTCRLQLSAPSPARALSPSPSSFARVSSCSFLQQLALPSSSKYHFWPPRRPLLPTLVPPVSTSIRNFLVRHPGFTSTGWTYFLRTCLCEGSHVKISVKYMD